MTDRKQGMKYYKQPRTESEIKDWVRGARAYTEWSLEEIERLKQENEDLRICLRRMQYQLDGYEHVKV